MIMLNSGRLAATLLISFCVSAGTLDGESAVISESVSVQLASSGNTTANISANTVVVNPEYAMSPHFRLYISLSNGATFADTNYVLEQSTAGAATGVIDDFFLVNRQVAGSSELEFAVLNPAGIDGDDEYILSGTNAAGQIVNVNLPKLDSGEKIEIEATSRDYIGVYEFYDAIEVFNYANEFTANVSTLADAIIDRSSDAQAFTNGTLTDEIAVNFSTVVLDNGVMLSDADKIRIELSGDLSHISSITLKNNDIVRGSFELNNTQASFVTSASDAFASVSNLLTLTVSGNELLDARSFKLTSSLVQENGSSIVLLNENTNAGEWRYNGLQAKAARMLLNDSGSNSLITFANEGLQPTSVTAEIRWFIDENTHQIVNFVDLGDVPAKGLMNVTEDVFLQALGNPSEPVEVFITFNVLSDVDQVHITAERSSSDGRSLYPILYNTNGVVSRTWLN